MTEDNQGFVATNVPEGENADFYADSPKGVIREDTSTSSSVGGDRAVEAPEARIDDHRDIAYTDPHVREALTTLIDWIVGDGFNLSPRNYKDPMDSESSETPQTRRSLI